MRPLPMMHWDMVTPLPRAWDLGTYSHPLPLLTSGADQWRNRVSDDFQYASSDGSDISGFLQEIERDN